MTIEIASHSLDLSRLRITSYDRSPYDPKIVPNFNHVSGHISKFQPLDRVMGETDYDGNGGNLMKEQRFGTIALHSAHITVSANFASFLHATQE